MSYRLHLLMGWMKDLGSLRVGVRYQLPVVVARDLADGYDKEATKDGRTWLSGVIANT